MYKHKLHNVLFASGPILAIAKNLTDLTYIIIPVSVLNNISKQLSVNASTTIVLNNRH